MLEYPQPAGRLALLQFLVSICRYCWVHESFGPLVVTLC
jgi:hypothetical protein